MRASILLACLAIAACSAENDSVSLGRDPQPSSAEDAGSDPAPREPPAAPPRPDRPGVHQPTEPEICEKLGLTATPVAPDLLIVLDRSESMEKENGFFGSTKTMRWEPAVEAVAQLTSALASRIRFGLAVFPNESHRCAAAELDVPLALDNAATIAANLSTRAPGGATPLAATLERALSFLIADRGVPDAPIRSKFVLLITDGEPNCSATLRDSNATDDQDSYAAIDRLREEDILTYVVGYDTGGVDVLDELARRGGTGDTMHRAVSDGPGLQAALQEISKSTVSCELVLDNPIAQPTYVRVEIDDQTYPIDESWVLRDERTVELIGEACAKMRDGQRHKVEVTVECEPIQID